MAPRWSFLTPGAYFLGGKTAIEKVLSLFATASGGAENDLEATVQKARGVRSAFYSLFVYMPTAWISIWLVIILQAMVVAALLRLTFRLICPNREQWQATAFIAVLSALTSAPWATTNVMPDIFTATMSLAIAITIAFWKQLSRRAAIILFFVIAGSMVMHLTNLPMGLGVMAVGIVAGLDRFRAQRKPILLTAGALVLGALGMLAVAVVGFGQWTLAPQSPPFLLARSIEDGPATGTCAPTARRSVT